jgi:hypothetical protein
VMKMMKERHPESELVGVDSHFINPFSKVTRPSESSDGGGSLKKA